jgi:hypothetical protein
MNADASSFMNEILSGSNLFRRIFSLARSSADPDESMPANRCTNQINVFKSNLWNVLKWH